MGRMNSDQKYLAARALDELVRAGELHPAMGYLSIGEKIALSSDVPRSCLTRHVVLSLFKTIGIPGDEFVSVNANRKRPKRANWTSPAYLKDQIRAMDDRLSLVDDRSAAVVTVSRAEVL